MCSGMATNTRTRLMKMFTGAGNDDDADDDDDDTLPLLLNHPVALYRKFLSPCVYRFILLFYAFASISSQFDTISLTWLAHLPECSLASSFAHCLAQFEFLVTHTGFSDAEINER